MATFLLAHEHAPSECRVSFAAWRGFDSPLRGQQAMASCPSGEHQVFWTVEADTADAALALLPAYVAARTRVTEVSPVAIR